MARPRRGERSRAVQCGLGAPQAIFTDPQIIAVGRTEGTARADGFSVRVIERDIAEVTGAGDR